jgi:hypothetical protein
LIRQYISTKQDRRLRLIRPDAIGRGKMDA